MNKVTEVLSLFKSFLNESWRSVNKFETLFNSKEDTVFKSFSDDWLQANWEILVERNLLSESEFLEAYGDGADCNGSSSRIWLPEASATHRIICSSESSHSIIDLLTNRSIESQSLSSYEFIKFTSISKNNKWHEDAPPFNCILLSHPKDVQNILIPVQGIVFEIKNIDA